jgi:hypothetical protein
MLETMSTHDRIEEKSFCYDPDFPPDVAEGKLLASAAKPSPPPAGVRKALRACGSAAASITRRNRS